MNDIPDLPRLAKTIGDPSRIRMLALLMEGRALTAKELAYGAGVEPATATAHLRRLEEDGLIKTASQGRHKYFQLASPDVARLVETLMVVAPLAVAAPVDAAAPIRAARMCYDHLAGGLGIGLTDCLVGQGWLQQEAGQFALTPAGEAGFNGLGFDLASLRRGRRQFAAACLDWTERRHHLAGALGAALAAWLQQQGWVQRQKHSRVVNLTPEGAAALARYFGYQTAAGEITS